MADGTYCRAPARAGGHCFFHDPDTAEAAAEARRTGGLRRRRNEATLAGFYELGGLRTLDDCVRLLELAAFDTLDLDTSNTRSRTLMAIAREQARIIGTAEALDGFRRLERLLGRPRPPASADPLEENDDGHSR